MSQILKMDDLINAIQFASQKHEGQVRKGVSALPYITHPIAVAKSIAEIGHIIDPQILIAAILHDTIEDTETNRSEIKEEFGEEVLNIILEVSDDKSLKRAERKRLQLLHTPKLSPKARIIKIADKLENCRDIIEDPPKDWSLKRKQDYIQWGADVVSRIRGTNAPLEAAFDQILAKAEQELQYKIQPYDTIDERPWSPNKKPSTQE